MTYLERLGGSGGIHEAKRRRPPLPLSLRQIEWDRFDPNEPFPLVVARRGQPSRKRKRRVPVLSLHRSSVLWSMALWLFPLMLQDTWNILPSAVMVECLAAYYLWELYPEFSEALPYLFNHEKYTEDQRKLEQERLREHYQRIMFELQVLQGRQNVRLVTRVENGVTNIYAVD